MLSAGTYSSRRDLDDEDAQKKRDEVVIKFRIELEQAFEESDEKRRRMENHILWKRELWCMMS